MTPVQTSTSERLTEAAIQLLDAARYAATEGPRFKPGRSMTAETMALAVQAIFMADRWNDAPGMLISIDARETVQRIRGLGMGAGCALGSLQSEEAQQAAALSFTQAMVTSLAQRRDGRRRGEFL